MLKFNHEQKKQPPGGHHYVEYGKTFRGEDVPALAEQVKDFRLANNIASGNPEQEILHFYLKHWPYMVKEDRDAKEEEIDESYRAWRDWIYKTWKTPPKKLLTTKEAKDRWEICLKCPKLRRGAWEPTEEKSELLRRAYILKRGIETPQNLRFCACHKSDLSVFVFTDPASSFSAKKDAEQPKECWV